MKFRELAHLYLGCFAKATYVTKDGDTEKDVLVELKNYRRLESVGIEGDRRILMWVGWNLSASQHKPILRRLSDMTKVEQMECDKNGSEGWHTIANGEPISMNGSIEKVGLAVTHRQAREIYYLTSRHFDLFGLIDSGEAIDAATLSPNPYA